MGTVLGVWGEGRWQAEQPPCRRAVRGAGSPETPPTGRKLLRQGQSAACPAEEPTDAVPRASRRVQPRRPLTLSCCWPTFTWPAFRTSTRGAFRWLASGRRGLPVYVEGLTDDGVNVFKLKATALSDVGAEQIAEARRSLADARELKGPEAAELARQCEALIARHRLESLELGAVLGPCAEGLIEVRALDDAEALKAAQPRWLGGELFDPRRQGQGGRDGGAAGGN